MNLYRKIQEIILYDIKVDKLLNNFLLFTPKNKFERILKILKRNKIIAKTGNTLGLNVKCKGKITFPHPHNIIIGDNVEIGKNCIIYQNVTIGKKRDFYKKLETKKSEYPKIGNNVIVYAGAIIIGDIKIGNNVIIGANSVVTHNIPNDVVIGGIPANILKYRKSFKND